MTLRGSIGSVLSQPIYSVYASRVAVGSLPRMPIALWRHVPSSAKKWIGWRVFDRGEEFAWSRIDADPILRSLCPRTEYAVSPSTVLFLWKLLNKSKPARLIEFGSGTSTCLLGAYARQFQQVGLSIRVVSIEDDASYLEVTRSRLRREGLESYVELLHCPVSDQMLMGRTITAYSLREEDLVSEARDGEFDLCLIDGPPGSIGRVGCLPLVARHLAHGATVLIDDAYRSGEQDAIRTWRKAFPGSLGNLKLLLADGHGLAMATWKLPRRKAECSPL